MPLLRLTQRRAVERAERAHPELEQRLTTFFEKQREGGDPFIELLARDTLSLTQHAEPRTLVEDRRLFALSGAGSACLIVLVWMIAAGLGMAGLLVFVRRYGLPGAAWFAVFSMAFNFALHLYYYRKLHKELNP